MTFQSQVEAHVPAHHEAPPSAAAKRATLLSLCVGVMLAFINVSSTISALSAIQDDLHASPSQLVWISSAYSLVVVALVMSAGTLGDLVGRRLVFAVGSAIFAAASALAFASHSTGLLIASQALMGIGGASVLPTSLSIVSHTFSDPHERTGAIGVWASTSGLGLAIGPVVSGLLLQHFSWHSVFLTNVVLGVVAVVLSLVLVPESKHPSRHLDPVGMVLLTVGLASGAYALIEGASVGYAAGQIVAAYAVTLVAFALFVRAELRHHDPMLDLRLFRSRSFTAVMALVTTTLFGFVGLSLLSVLYLEDVRELSALATGVRLLVMFGSYIAVSAIAARIVRRVGFVLLLSVGLAVMAVGAFALLSIGPFDGFDHMWFGLLISGTGAGLIVAPSTAAAVNSVPPHQAGMAASAINMFRQLGNVLGPAVLGTVVTSRFPRLLSDRLTDARVPGPVTAQVVTGATHGADPSTLPPAIRGTALDAIARSFTSSVHLGLVIGGIVLAVMVVPTVLFVRHRQA